MTRRTSRRRGRGAAALAVAGFLPLVMGSPASAHPERLTCRFAPHQDDDGLGVEFLQNPSASFFNPTDASLGAWNQANGSRLIFNYNSGGFRDVAISFVNVPGGTFAPQVSQFGPECNSNNPPTFYHPDRDPLFEWNIATTYSPQFYNNAGTLYLTPEQQKRVISIHEIGHVFGLKHNGSIGCNINDTGLLFGDPNGGGTPLVKFQQCDWVNPTAHDISDVQTFNPK